jgi:Uma2 family endonuclease
MQSVATPTLMSVQAYLEYEKTSDVRHDYVGGVLYALPGAKKEHNEIILNAVAILRSIVRRQGCRMFAESIKLHPTPDAFYYPDLMVTCEASDDSYVVENACLVIEVLSPTTHMRDRLEKWLAYKQMDSLQHYLLVHQDEMLVEHFYRQEDGTWQVKIERENVTLSCPEVVLELPELYAGIL